MQVGNEFENKSESITGDEHIANGFNNYFVNVGPSLADNTPATDTQFSQYLSASTNVKNSLFLNPVTEVDILQFVANSLQAYVAFSRFDNILGRFLAPMSKSI